MDRGNATAMREHLERELAEAAARLATRGLFDPLADTISLRWPGREEMLWTGVGGTESRLASLDSRTGDPGLHATVYRARSDAGAALLGATAWSAHLETLGVPPPVLFDEQARHIGEVASPVAAGNTVGLMRALARGSNVAVYGEKRICLGTTWERLVGNAEVFEKCALAFVVARSTGQRLATIPWWVRAIAGRRLRRDQRRAAESFAQGRIPEVARSY
jgi:ribulose-5-phosphate 4-epimerase/fuculose-1-phosphate aldolase